MSHNHQILDTQGEHKPTSLDSGEVSGTMRADHALHAVNEACGSHTLSDHGHERHCLRKTGFKSVTMNTHLLSTRQSSCLVGPLVLIFINAEDKGKAIRPGNNKRGISPQSKVCTQLHIKS